MAQRKLTTQRVLRDEKNQRNTPIEMGVRMEGSIFSGITGRFHRNMPPVALFNFFPPLPLPAENYPLLAAFNGLNPRPQSVILLSYKNISAVLSRPKGVLTTMPAESKPSVQVKTPPASASIQQRNLVLADLSGQEPSAQA